MHCVLSKSTLAMYTTSVVTSRRSAHEVKRVLLVSLRAPAFSPLVYLCKYSPSIYNNTRVLCAPPPCRGGGDGGTRHGHMPRKITIIVS